MGPNDLVTRLLTRVAEHETLVTIIRRLGLVT